MKGWTFNVKHSNSLDFLLLGFELFLLGLGHPLVGVDGEVVALVVDDFGPFLRSPVKLQQPVLLGLGRQLLPGRLLLFLS